MGKLLDVPAEGKGHSLSGGGSRNASRSAELRLGQYRDASGDRLTAWVLASRPRRAGAWAVDVLLFVGTLGVAWLVTVRTLWPHGTTPGKPLLGLRVFGTDTRCPADRRRMARRCLVHRTAARALGIATLGIGYAYVVGGAAGAGRRTLYDEWAQTVVLAGPAERTPASEPRPPPGCDSELSRS